MWTRARLVYGKVALDSTRAMTETEKDFSSNAWITADPRAPLACTHKGSQDMVHDE